LRRVGDVVIGSRAPLRKGAQIGEKSDAKGRGEKTKEKEDER
jgi:hypothetical protein